MTSHIAPMRSPIFTGRMLTLLFSIDNGDLITALQLVYRFLRNHHCALFDVGDEPHVSKLSGPQNVSRIRKRHVIADRSSPRIQAAIERIKLTFMRIQLAIAEDQVKVEAFYVSVALSRVRMARNEICKRPFAGSHDSFDRIDLRHGCEWSRSWPDQIADLIVGKSSDAINRCDNFRVAEIDLGLFHRCFVCFDVCSARLRGGGCSITLLVADNFLLKQIQRALFVCICFYLVGFVFCQSSLGLRQCGFEWPRIDLKKEIALLDHAALLVVARNDVALNLRVDVGVDKTVQRRDAFEHARHILRLHSCHKNFRRRRSGLCRFTRATDKQRATNQHGAHENNSAHTFLIAAGV